MALVLRKAFFSRNATILKSIKGRPMATAPNKKATAPLLHKHMKRSLGKRMQRLTLKTFPTLNDAKRQIGIAGVLRQPYKTVSCPCVALSTISNSTRTVSLPRSYSAIYPTDCNLFLKNVTVPNQMLPNLQRRPFSTDTLKSGFEKTSADFVRGLEAICTCPCPCPGSCSLPPPCNTPPKCLQYMTGYYYYPYGTWFCGPYHVATGPCGPCTGPVVPGGPCGPCGPCPGTPCGPPGVSPCCACGPCRPLGCCGVCGVAPPNMAPPNTSSAQFVPFGMQGGTCDPYAVQNSVQYSYDPHPTFSPYPPNSMPWDQAMIPGPNMPGHSMPGPNMPGQNMPSPMPTPFFGPGVNVPITPIPFNSEPCGPITPSPSTMPSSPKPKSSVSLNPNYLQETRAGAPSGTNRFFGPKPPIPVTRTPPKSSAHFSKTYTGTRPISTLRNPCSSNLIPKPLRQSPPSRYDAICALSKNNPFNKPRINSRTLQRPDAIQICYYTTRSMKKYANAAHVKNERKHLKKQRQDKICSLKQQKVEDVKSTPLCYWCLLCGKKSCPCQHCGSSTSAHKWLPIPDNGSKNTTI